MIRGYVEKWFLKKIMITLNMHIGIFQELMDSQGVSVVGMSASFVMTHIMMNIFLKVVGWS